MLGLAIDDVAMTWLRPTITNTFLHVHVFQIHKTKKNKVPNLPMWWDATRRFQFSIQMCCCKAWKLWRKVDDDLDNYDQITQITIHTSERNIQNELRLKNVKNLQKYGYLCAGQTNVFAMIPMSLHTSHSLTLDIELHPLMIPLRSYADKLMK